MSDVENMIAVLKNIDSIEVAVSKAYDSPLIKEMRLYEDGKFLSKMKCLSRSESKSTFIYTFTFSYHLHLGCLYELADGKNEFVPLNISLLGSSLEVDEKYRYDGELGAIYSPEKTIFRVFSPLANEAIVKINIGKEISYHKMERLECGVFQSEVSGDLDRASYLYIVRINGRYVTAVDPYAKSVGTNSRVGYVVDMAKIEKIDLHMDSLKPFSDYCHAIIYECNVRDMTSLTYEKDKGSYNCLARSGIKDEKGNPEGLDYIASLNVTHVQLLPVFDFQTINDEDPSSSYNWGYDPLFFFAPEGSYSSDPSDPYKRMEELRNLVGSFHQCGIRVNMDVVFNHTFQVISNSLQKLCPNYYYRFNDDGSLSNGSGCFNDVETRHYMARKLIVDSLTHFVKFYGMDGFRFDLMGIIDKDTLNSAYFAVKTLNHSAMMYGEGWDLPTNLPSTQKGSLNNAFAMKDFGFFNDRFRDICKGKSFGANLSSRGYLTGDLNYIDGFKHVFLGSVISLAYPPLFAEPSQSINYLECHDDATLFDKIAVCCPNESESLRLKRIMLCNACVILGFGVPFIHAGQEFGQSKDGTSNSYNSGDQVNGLRYNIAASRKDMVRYLQGAIKLKETYPCFTSDNKKEITDKVTFENLPNGALAVKYINSDDSSAVIVIINPSDVTVRYQFDKYYRIVFNEAGLMEKPLYSQLVLVNGITLIVAMS